MNINFTIHRIAHIKQSLKLYDQAVIDYFGVLNKIANHVPTLKGKKSLMRIKFN